MPNWVGGLVKYWTFSYKSWFFCNSKHFCQKIMTPCYSCYFWIFYIFNFFQIIMLSLSNTVVYCVNSKCLFPRGKQQKNCWNNSLIKSPMYLLIFGKKSIIFEGNPNSPRESYFPRGVFNGGVLNLGSLNSPLHRNNLTGMKTLKNIDVALCLYC